MAEPSAESAPPQFNRVEIEDAGREYGEVAARMASATYDQWVVHVRAFVRAFGDSPVLAHVVQPLREYEFDLRAWHEARVKHTADTFSRGMQPFDLPRAPEQAAAFALQLIESLALEGTPGEIVATLLGGNDGHYGLRMGRMTTRLLNPLTPYVEERLRTLRRTALPPAAPAAGLHIGSIGSLAALFAAEATVTGSNFAAGVASSAHQTAHTPRSDFANEIASWADLLGDVEAHRHAEVRAAIAALARAADDGGVRPSTLAAAAEVVVEAAPSLRERVGKLLQRARGDTAKLAGAAAVGAATKAGEGLAEHHDEVAAALSAALRFFGE